MVGIIRGAIISSMFWAVILWAAFSLGGCGATTGWRVEFGAHPVTATYDQQGLDRKALRDGEFETRTR